MTTLEIILISYILLNWFLGIMFVVLPKKVIDKVFFVFIIICPPFIIGVIIGVIGELIKEKHDKRKEKEKEERENDYA